MLGFHGSNRFGWAPGANYENKSGSLWLELILCVRGDPHSMVIRTMEKALPHDVEFAKNGEQSYAKNRFAIAVSRETGSSSMLNKIAKSPSPSPSPLRYISCLKTPCKKLPIILTRSMPSSPTLPSSPVPILEQWTSFCFCFSKRM